jgi:hypothetical protein
MWVMISTDLSIPKTDLQVLFFNQAQAPKLTDMRDALNVPHLLKHVMLW